jgi:hypothetical protein
MRFYTNVHEAYCGIDLHARTMYVCILNRDGEILLHRNMPTSPETFLKAIAPYRQDLVVAVECMFTWYWLADLCAQEGLTFVLGHAQYMKADPRRQSEERPSRRPEDCRAPAGRHVTAGLCIPGHHAGHPRLAAAPPASGAAASGAVDPYSPDKQSVQFARVREVAQVQSTASGDRPTLCRSSGAEKHRRRFGFDRLL